MTYLCHFCENRSACQIGKDGVFLPPEHFDAERAEADDSHDLAKDVVLLFPERHFQHDTATIS
jgi:hypothetical protein